MKSDKELAVLLFGARVGTLACDRGGKLSFAYDARSPNVVPLSVSLPLARREHGHEAVEAFLWGLLPDNDNVLERWGREFHVSARNPFALLAHVGSDCAGAVQIVPFERVESIEGPGPVRVDWLDDAALADRLRALRIDETAWSRADDEGRFSLAGAQPKMALFFDGQRWGIPVGRTPTTHILKPSIGAWDGQVENEHFCLRLARALGLPVARSEIQRFGEETAIVVERYDRVRITPELASPIAASAAGQPVLRLHQEDFCQALGVRPRLKYQNDGGPSPQQVVTVLRAHSTNPAEDVATFTDALLLNWLIGGSDGHAKNYSVLHAQRGVRLAPLYDIASALPYPDLNTPKLKLAMKLGSEYRLQRIGAAHLSEFAVSTGQKPEAVLERARLHASQLPDLAHEVLESCTRDGLTHAILKRTADAVAERAQACRTRLM
jgi:serine/threonine-protein kinase HipA